MSVSFWIFLGLCVVSFLGALIAHSNAYEEYKSANGRERFWKWLNLVVIVWGLPAGSLVGTIFTGFESLSSDRRMDGMDPLKKPIATVSAVVKLRVKGDAFSGGFDPEDSFNPNAGLLFLQATNVTDKAPSIHLSAGKPDISVFNSFPHKLNERDVIISFSEGDVWSKHFMNRANSDKKASFFEEARSLVISMSAEIGTNTIVLSGTATVTVNSSLIWTFQIPEQRPKHGLLSSKQSGKDKWEVMPLSVKGITGNNLGMYDGK
jgi:hypothetical protein